VNRPGNELSGCLLISGSGVRNPDGAPHQSQFSGTSQLRGAVCAPYCIVEKVCDLSVHFATRHVHVLRHADLRVPEVIGPVTMGGATVSWHRLGPCDMTLQFLYGLIYIHSQGFLHRRRCGSGCPATLNISEASATKTFSASMRSRLPSARVTSNAVVDGVWFISRAFPRTRPATTPARWVPARRADRVLP